MIQLKAEDMRQAAKPLLNESSPTFAHAIADGIIDGKMYADHSVSPRSAVFKHLREFIILPAARLKVSGTNGIIT